jgi:hypothetical protein
MPDNNTNGFTGIRYLMNKADETEYALSYVNGLPERPLHAFNACGATSLPPNATILAVDDDYEQTKSGFVDAMIFQLKTDSSGQLVHLKVGPASYPAKTFHNIITPHKKSAAIARGKFPAGR